MPPYRPESREEEPEENEPPGTNDEGQTSEEQASGEDGRKALNPNSPDTAWNPELGEQHGAS